jgi:hypothetical protein
MKKKKKQKIPAHLRHIHGIEMLDLDSVYIQVSPFALSGGVQGRFGGFILHLGVTDSATFATMYPEDITQTATRAEFQLGYNPQTKKPQISWRKKPKNFDLVRATDILVAALFGMIHPYDPAMLFPELGKPKKPKKKKRKTRT